MLLHTFFDKKVEQFAHNVRLTSTYRYPQPPREFDLDESTDETPVYTLVHGLLRTASLLGEGAKANSIIAARLFLLIDGDVGCAGVPSVRKPVRMSGAIDESGARDCDQMLTLLYQLTNRGQ